MLRPEARQLMDDQHLSERSLLREANGRVDNIFTQESLAKIHTLVLIYFTIFQSSATLALSGASILLGSTSRF